jgi:hypothetical protein
MLTYFNSFEIEAHHIHTQPGLISIAGLYGGSCLLGFIRTFPLSLVELGIGKLGNVNWLRRP